MKIGELARAAEVHVETIRYYQRIRLLPVPDKSVRGVRLYTDNDLSRLRFIRRAKELGFSLKDIRLLLQLDKQSCNEVRRIAGEKLSEVRSRIADLESIAATLETMIRQCETSDESACPIIDSLTQTQR